MVRLLAPGTVAACVVALAAGPVAAQVVDVPGPNLPSIQAGVDALPNGGTVRIAPGTYRENVVVSGQQIALENADAANLKMPLIKARDPQGAVLTYLNGGGGTLTNLQLQGGAVGIGAGLFDAEQSTTATTDLQLQGVQIRKAGRGIAGRFHSLQITGGEIAKSTVHGISLQVVGPLVIDGVSVHDNDGVGLLIINDVAPAGSPPRVVRNSEFVKNGGGGIDVRGGVLPVTIDHCNAVNNRLFGVSLVGAANTVITDSSLSFSRAVAGFWGEGLRNFRSNSVTVTNVTMSFNAGAGLSARGCLGADAHVDLMDNVLNSDGLQLVSGDLKGCAPQTATPFTDLGGNSCDAAACIASSSSLVPIPAPVSP